VNREKPMTRVHRATWVLPISRPPIRDGWVAVDDGRIVDRGSATEMPPAFASLDSGASESDLSSTVILPALVNAHAHLELSWMRGQVPKGTSMPQWASALMALRLSIPADPLPAILDGIDEAWTSGTILIGDVANTCATYLPLSRSELSAVIFRELIGFRVDDPEAMIADAQGQLDALPAAATMRVRLVPHAPYSVSSPLLAALGAHADGPLSIHLAESTAELEFLQTGAGPWRAVLDSVGAWNPAWHVPGCGPVEYLERLGLVSASLLAVHGVHFTERELSQLARVGATIVTCPRSNEWTGAGVPPIARFYESGARVAIGTDSLASVDSLNLFDEMAVVRRLAPGVPASRILQSATLDGAAALGFDDLGSIAPGKRAALLSVRVPMGLDDVEEYLVGGVRTTDVRWLS
jgi:cytosine/adenosine deaminase-related metal-dependent hydrolase